MLFPMGPERNVRSWWRRWKACIGSGRMGFGSGLGGGGRILEGPRALLGEFWSVRGGGGGALELGRGGKGEFIILWGRGRGRRRL